MEDVLLGQNVQGYVVDKFIGEGAIGKVYRAYNNDIEDYRAIKFIPIDSATLRDNWKNEIIKVNKLGRNDNVVKYYIHGNVSIDSCNYLYIMWDYIDNDSLKSLIDTRKLSIPMLVDIIDCCLSVLHACSIVGIVHADLHSGNILIQKEDKTYIDPTRRKILITDFGRLTQYSQEDYLDDYIGLSRIIQDSLNSIRKNSLNSEHKKIYSFLKEVYPKYLLEQSATAGKHFRNPIVLLDLFKSNINSTNDEKSGDVVGVSDYLTAEHLGEYFNEWRTLFVPKFIAIDEIVRRNINVLTGLRGCGKTMLFRRLSSYFNCKLGDSDIPGSNGFYGFYLNAHNIAEAFPWLPDYKKDEARNQVINHFNLCWCLEILRWLKEFSIKEKCDLTFLNRFFKQYYEEYFSFGNSEKSIFYLTDLINKNIINARLESSFKKNDWPLSQYNFLELFVNEIKTNVPQTQNKPFYFFLDDYSSPMVRESIQSILNPVIFRRSADVIFKISTESVESFIPIGLHGKTLEETADYILVDCGTMTLTKSRSYIKDILFSILKPRIKREPLLKERKIDSLDDLLGETILDNEGLANAIREGVGSYHYQGSNIFCDVWSSDIREMINLLAVMIDNEDKKRLSGTDLPIISKNVQNNVYMNMGG